MMKIYLLPQKNRLRGKKEFSEEERRKAKKRKKLSKSRWRGLSWNSFQVECGVQHFSLAMKTWGKKEIALFLRGCITACMHEAACMRMHETSWGVCTAPGDRTAHFFTWKKRQSFPPTTFLCELGQYKHNRTRKAKIDKSMRGRESRCFQDRLWNSVYIECTYTIRTQVTFDFYH